MEHSSFDLKAVKGNVKRPDQTGSAGREGNTFTPPAYGIESLDSAQVGAIQMKTAGTALPNHTGLPDSLKVGVEALSGLSPDDVLQGIRREYAKEGKGG